MSTMSYMGFTARVEYDDRDALFTGRVLGIRAIIGFHGSSVAELRQGFEAAVEDYLAACREQGVTPEKPLSGKLLLRLPPELHGRAQVAAEAAGISLNQWAARALERAVGRRV